MLLTGSLSDTEIFHKAVLALQVFFLSLFVGISSLLLLTINETTEVGILTCVTLVVRASVESVFKLFTLVEITWSVNAAILEDSFSFGLFDCHPFNLSLDLYQRSQCLCNRFAIKDVNWGFAGRAAHECKAHSKSWMTVFEELYDAVDMEYMTAT